MCVILPSRPSAWPDLSTDLKPQDVSEMLHALDLLGGMYSTPNKASTSSTPAGPPTPPRTRSPYFRKPVLVSESRLESDLSPSKKRVKRDLTVDLHTPRRSKRLEAKILLPPTPESLPRRELRVRVKDEIDTHIKSSEHRKRRRKTKLTLAIKPEIVLETAETGLTEALGKIHLIQGPSGHAVLSRSS